MPDHPTSSKPNGKFHEPDAEQEPAPQVGVNSKTAEQWLAEIKQDYASLTNAWGKTVGQAVALGHRLNAAKEDVGDGEWLKFAAQLPFTARKAQMLMRIAANSVIGDAKYISHLPASWSALNELAKLSERDLKRLIERKAVHAEMTVEDAKQLVAQHVGDDEASDKLFAEFLRHLSHGLALHKKLKDLDLGALMRRAEADSLVAFIEDRELVRAYGRWLAGPVFDALATLGEVRFAADLAEAKQ